MASEITTGVFNEQLKITVDFSDLRRGLAAAAEEWRRFKEGLGADAGNVFQGTMLAGLAKSIQNTSETLKGLSNEVLANNAVLTRKLGDMVDAQTNKVIAGNTKEINAAKAKAKELAKINESVYGPSLSQLGTGVPPKLARDIAIGNEGTSNLTSIALDKEIAKKDALFRASAEKIRDEQAQIQADYDKSQEISVAKKDKLFRSSAEKIADEQAQIQADYDKKQEASIAKKDKLYSSSAQKIADEQAQILGEYAGRIEKAESKIYSVSHGRKSELFKTEILNAKSLDEQLSLVTGRLETLNKRKKNLSQIETDASNRNEVELQARIAESLLKTDKEINAVLRVRNSILDKISSDEKRAAKEAEKLANHTKEVADQAKRAQGFFGRLVDGEKWSSTLAHLARFYLLWNGVQGAIWAAGEAMKAPFQLLGVGVKYLQDTERAADDLVGVIATNMKFSDNYAENFKIAQTASVAVTEALQEQAILTGFSTDALEKTFSALAESGATKYVKTLKEMVELTTDFQMALKAAGAGGMAAQTSVQEMFKLFSGNPGKDNKFLAWLGVDPSEWAQMRESAKETGDLVVRISEKSEAFRDALIAAGQGQVVIIGNLKLLFSKLAGEGTKPLFEALTKTLRDINDWFVKNRELIVDYMTRLGLGAVEIINSIKEAFGNEDFLDGIMSAFLRLELIIADAVKPLAQVISDLNEIGEKGIVGGIVSQFQRRREYAAIEEGFRKDAVKEVVKTSPSLGGSAFFDAVDTIVRKKMEEFRQAVLKDPRMEREYKNDARYGSNESTEERSARIEAAVAKAREERAARSKSSVLTDPFKSGNLRGGEEDILARVNAEFRAAEEAYKAATDRIKQAIAKRQDVLNDSLAAGDESKASFAAKALGLDKEQQASILVEFEKFMVKANSLKNRVSSVGFGGLDINKQAAASLKITTDIMKSVHDLSNEQYQAGRKLVANDLAVTKEREAIRVAQSTFELSLIKNRLSAEEQMVRAAEQAGFKTELDAFDEVQDIKRRGYEVDRKQRELNLANAKNDTAEVAAIRRGMAEAEQKNAQDVAMAANQRVTIINKERVAAVELVNTLRQQNIQLAEATLNRERILNPTKNLIELERELLSLKESGLLKKQEEARAELSAATLASGGKLTDRVIKAKAAVGAIEVELSNTSIEKLSKELDGMGGGLRTVRSRQLSGGKLEQGPGLIDGLFGTKFKETFSTAEGRVGKFGVGLIGAANALQQFKSIVGSIRQGIQEGGALGGVGAGVSAASGIMGMFKGDKGFGKLMGQLGPYAAAAGAVISIIGGLMTAAAKRIADSIKKSLDQTITSFNRGQTNLVNTIAEVERLRNDAITRLSGKKGGKDELDKLLPGIDDQLYSLKKQQTDIITAFNDGLEALRLSSDTLTSIKNQWQDINKQVSDYIGAGGDAAKAAEYLSLELAKIRLDAVNELNDAEQDAIQTMQKLNDLLEQRNQLIDDFKQKEFDLITADAVDRRQAGSVLRGKQLADLRTAHQKALDDLDAEINLTTEKVKRETTVFNLVNDTAALRRRDEELTLIALDAQIQKWKDLQSIVAGITLGPNGNIGSGVTGPVTINVNVTAPTTGDPSGWAKDVGDSIANAYMDRMRSVPS